MSDLNLAPPDLVPLALKGQIAGLQITPEGLIVSVVIGIPADQLNLPRVLLAGQGPEIALDPVVDVTLRIDKKRVKSAPPASLLRRYLRNAPFDHYPIEVWAAQWDGSPEQAIAFKAAGCAVEFEAGGAFGPTLRVGNAFAAQNDWIVKHTYGTSIFQSDTFKVFYTIAI